MNLEAVQHRLRKLDESPGYGATRFDEGSALQGRIAVLPSAFNPPTRAHLRLLALAASIEGIDGLAALLSTRNVDKAVSGASFAERVEMLLAQEDDIVQPVAVLASNAARLVDQGEALLEAFPQATFDFVVGFDTLVRVFDRKYYDSMKTALERFFAAHRLLASTRGERDLSAVTEFLREPAVRPWARRIVPMEIDAEHGSLSSSLARERAASGDADHAVTASVARYIRDHGLYGASSQLQTG